MSEHNLPNGWTRAPLGDVASIDSDLVDPAQHSQMPHIAPNHIESGTGRLLPYTTIAEDKVTSPKHRFRAGQILYSKIRPYLAKAALVDFEGLCSADMYPISTKLEAAYLHRWLISDEFTARVSQDQGRTVLPKVNQAALVKIEVPIPPLAEQRRIVFKLESLLARSRRAKEALDAIPTLLEQFRQSVLAAAFRGDLTADWRAQYPDVEPASKLLERIRTERRRQWEETELQKMREKGKSPTSEIWKEKYVETEAIDVSAFPTPPTGWYWARLGQLGDIETGFTPPTSKAEYFGGTIPFFKPTDLDQGYHVTKARETLSEVGGEHGRMLPPLSILVTCIGATIGKTGLARMRCTTNQQINALIVDSRWMSPHWLFWIISSPQGQSLIRNNASATTLPIINKGRFSSLCIPVPPLAEQLEITRRIEERLTIAKGAANPVNAAQNRIEKLEQKMLTTAFRGELVPQDPNDEPASVLLERIRAEREAGDGSTPKRSRGRRPAA